MTDTTGIPPRAAEKLAKSEGAVGGVFDRPGLAWAAFEWARNPYYILVIIYVFAPYLAAVVTQQALQRPDLVALAETDPERAQEIAAAAGLAAIAAVTKWAGFAAGLTAPFLGAALDKGGRRKPPLILVLTVLALCSWSLWFAQPDGTGLTPALVALAVASVCYTYSEVIHNSMLPVAGRPASLPLISGLGLALGNGAATVLFVALVLMFSLPDMVGWPFAEPLFGVDPAQAEERRLVGPISAMWLALFIPVFFVYAKDGGTPGASWVKAGRQGAVQLWTTLRRASDNKNILKFLLARMLYADAMAALLALGAVYAGQLFGWGLVEFVAYAIVASIAAFGGGLLGGWLDRRFGPKISLIITISGMIAVLVVQLSMTPTTMFFGLVQSYPLWDGPVFKRLVDVVYLGTGVFLAITATASISSSRSMLVHLAPPDRVGEFFGLFAIAGTVTVWLGPLLIEIFANLSGNQRIGMSAIGLLFLLGLGVLLTVQSGKTPAHSAERAD